MSNQTFGTPVSLKEIYWSHEKLSKRLRMLVSQAPYDYNTKPILEAQRRLGDVKACEWFIDKVFSDRDEQIAKTYGKDHPQYGARPQGWRRHAT